MIHCLLSIIQLTISSLLYSCRIYYLVAVLTKCCFEINNRGFLMGSDQYGCGSRILRVLFGDCSRRIAHTFGTASTLVRHCFGATRSVLEDQSKPSRSPVEEPSKDSRRGLEAHSKTCRTNLEETSFLIGLEKKLF